MREQKRKESGSGEKGKAENSSDKRAEKWMVAEEFFEKIIANKLGF